MPTRKGHHSPSWADIRRLSRLLVRELAGDRFLDRVLFGCRRVGRDKGNPLRGNFVASGLREALGHVLHSLAPDAEVRACAWFEQAKDTPTVTRRQRATYVVQGGLADDFVATTLHVDVQSWIEPLLDTLDSLNKATHVRPETILAGGGDIRTMFHEVLSGLYGLVEAAQESRGAVNRAVADVMHTAVFENLIAETIQELDELSTHTTIDDHTIDEVEVIRLTATEITYRVTGQVEVELQYGSNSDVENDIGLRQADSYPYEATVICNVADPMNVSSDALTVTVDNSSFYE